jgi:alpha-1,2-mannosyltransferase
MALLTARTKNDSPVGGPGNRRPGQAPELAAEQRLPSGRLTSAPGLRRPWPALAAVELVVLLAVLAAAVFVASRLDAWGDKGLDFSVYWYGGKILNDAGLSPSGLYQPTVNWAGGPELPFTYPPFAALLFSLLANLPQATALLLFNAAGVAVAAWVAALGVRYWNSKPSWRSTFASPTFRSALNRLGAVVLFLAVLNLGPWRETLAFGQINILLLGLMTADLLSRSPQWRNGVPGSGFLVGVAAGIKLTPLVFGLYFLVRKDWRGLRNMGAGFAFTVLLGWVLRPAESLSFWLEILPDTSRIGGAGYVDNLSIKGALLHFGVPAAAVNVPWLLLSLLVVGLGRGPHQDRQQPGLQGGGHFRHGTHHAPGQPRLVVAPLGLDGGSASGVRVDAARNSAAAPAIALGDGRRPGRVHGGVPVLAEDHRHGPGRREP